MPRRTRAGASRRESPRPLEQRLVLLAWLHERLGYADTRELLAEMATADEGFGADGRSAVCTRLISRAHRLDGVGVDDLLRYDANIREALKALNAGRPAPIVLRYFQYLAALYTEICLDFRLRRGAAELRDSLNEFIRRGGYRYELSDEPYRYIEFAESDLNKLAFWMATGSGKTLLLHLNYRQFLHYNRTPLDNVLLITPNEGLTAQHMAELAASGIPAARFDPGETGLPLRGPHAVKVVEITKLVMEKKGEGESVAVEAFEGANLVFVDEGHKGSGGEAWRRVRDAIGETGFTFEYSATFGQALGAAQNPALTAEYGKAIAFDYSYCHFYNDGHGKDFAIVNLERDAGDRTDMLLLGNLLSFYEQQTMFVEHHAVARRYNIDRPLWTLVGASVNAVYTENKRKRSDVLTAARFLHRLLADPDWAANTVARLLRGESGLTTGHGMDIFNDKFQYLRARDPDPASIYRGLLARTLHARAAGGLHICGIRRSEGELGLKAAGADDYFGLVYIGDAAAFKKLVQTDDSGITLEEDAMSDSLFDSVNRPDTKVEMLIGARKFMEGWNSWRVSAMGLLNIGRREGSQIVQMFGRGVRLRGLGMSLKRSAALPGSGPACPKELETLNIFALRANYMGEFRRYLEREGVATDDMLELSVPIRPDKDLLDKKLAVPRIDEGRDFKRETEIAMTHANAGRPVAVDMSSAVRTISSGAAVRTREASSGERRRIPSEALDLVDWNAVYLDIIAYAAERAFDNMFVSPRALRNILEAEPTAYSLICEDNLINPATLADLERLHDAVIVVLRKYADALYRRRRARWESAHMRYRILDESDPNFRPDSAKDRESGAYMLRVPRKDSRLIRSIRRLLADREKLYGDNFETLPRIYFDRHLYQPLPVQGARHTLFEVEWSPPGLNESERRFVDDIKRYWRWRCDRRPDDAAELFLLRNLSRGKGVGFFEDNGFYPDFILWIRREAAQRIVFVEPHGLMHAPAWANDRKARLYEKLPELARELSKRGLPRGITRVELDSFIISATPFEELRSRYDNGKWNRGDFAAKHILFRPETADAYRYMEHIFESERSESA